MADTRRADIRAVLGGWSGEDRVAAAHFVTGAIFLVIGGGLSLLSFISLRFAGLFPVSFGRLESMANLALLIGFGVISLVGGVYYVLPRLTGVRLWSSDLAGLGLLGISGVTLAGIAAVALGFGSGRQPFGLPWWIDVPMVFALVAPFMITTRTIAERVERRSYVTLWFVIGGVTWLPLLYAAHAAGHVPGLTQLSLSYGDLFLSSGLITMVILTLGTGLFYYTLVKELDVPLASRQLALVGFWSLGFASVWWGTAQLLFGPGPSWLAGVAAALGLAFPIGAIANAANASITLEGAWRELPERPGVASGIVGLYLAVGVAALAALGGFRSVAAAATLTPFWEALELTAVAGAGALLVAGVTFPALRRVTGRDLASLDRARSFLKYTVVGSVGVLAFMGAAGLISGYSWIAGSNSAAYVDAGEGWGAGAGAADALMLLALLATVILFMGQLAYASTIIGTLSSGRAVAQEVLVTVEPDDE